jgi:DNA invertase Pin-like site-specific DNA recombinase
VRASLSRQKPGASTIPSVPTVSLISLSTNSTAGISGTACYSLDVAKKIVPGNPQRAIAYIRVSTGAQELGPDAQRAAVERWAAAHGVSVVEVFEDAGLSGGSSIDARPGLLGALAALRGHGAGLLVAAKRCRLARDVLVATMIEQAAKRAGASITTADGASDGAGPEGQLMKGIVDVFSQYERAVIRARTKAALGVKAARGERVGMVPFGFRLADDGVHITENPAEQATIRDIEAMRADGMTLRAIANQCEYCGLVSRAGRPFGVTQIARVLGA